jgi:tRNA 5-methylaminomethyl-2-thiouridine biosynthesis bifunctional protein
MLKTFALPYDTIQNSYGRPFSTAFRDRYHSDDGAFEEARHVFVEANELSKILLQQKTITIGELGFGFGVSFLETCRFLAEFNTTNSTQCRINFLSVEGFPQTKEHFENFHIELGTFQNPLISPFIIDLLTQYPKRTRGMHRLFLSDSVILTLAYHPIDYVINNISLAADCWYLDGFSPSKNPEMWDQKTFAWVYKNTVQNGTFSTYSVSESVQTAASSVTFLLKKTTGFGRKASMLQGIKYSGLLPKQPKVPPPKVAVLGAGLAGASVAYSLSRRNIEVEVFEKEHAPARKASGNKAAVFMPQLSSVPDYLSRFFLAGYLHSLGVFTIPQIEKHIPSLTQNGVLRLSNVKKWEKVESQLEALGITKDLAKRFSKAEISSRLGITSKHSGIFFPESGSLHPEELIRALLENVKKVHLHTKVTSVMESDTCVELLTSDSVSHTYTHLVFANAHELAEFPDFSWLPFEKIKGQVFISKLKQGSETVDVPLCYDGYTLPIGRSGELFVGATYEHNAHETEFSDIVCDDLTKRLTTHFPQIAIDQGVTDGRVCFRTTSPDRLPMIGTLSENNTGSRIFTSIGHGSHGTSSCLLAGEIISSLILNEPLPIEDDLIEQIEPSRFLKRVKKKNKPLEIQYPASYVWRKKTTM